MVQSKHNRHLVGYARELRRNMTIQERRLWYGYLRGHPARFVRQKVMGRFILDFYSARAKLAVELDGSQHFEDAGQTADAHRTAFLQGYDVQVLRIPNNEVDHNFSGVCEAIEQALRRRDEKALSPGGQPLSHGKP